MPKYILKRRKQIKVPNVTIVGSPTINDNIVSEFSTSDYVKTPEIFTPENNTWEIVISIITGSDISTTQIFGCITATRGINLNIISILLVAELIISLLITSIFPFNILYMIPLIIKKAQI